MILSFGVRLLCFVLAATVVFAFATNVDSRSLSLRPRGAALDFTGASWIWSSDSQVGVLSAFRKDFTPPFGKSLIAAEIITAVDNSLAFYVNGQFIGNGSGLHGVRFARRFCASLLPSYNVFAVAASTTLSTQTPPAFIATIYLTYSDGTTDTLATDTSWRAMSPFPVDFAQLTFDDTTWPVATVVSTNPDLPFGSVFIPTDPPVVSFAWTPWVWTDISPSPSTGLVPPGLRAFRQTFTTAPGEVATTATIMITADDEYTLWVNGVLIGSNSNYVIAQVYTVDLAPTDTIVFAVLATNGGTGPNPAGLLASVEINMAVTGRASCTAGALLQTDVTWKSTQGSIPTGWELPGFDDSAWPPVVVAGLYPNAPWGSVMTAAPSPPVNA
ncbi:hypothetical protein B0H13DRAFT_2371302 [Mycena leptocephala]|nr:hypothetical protein B0H13DRAFT_2371302 [Mycena leptocephala]